MVKFRGKDVIGMVFVASKPSEYLEQLCKNLGAPYQIKVIDLEPVLYRDLENGYDIEVSGLNSRNHLKNATIYVWKTQGGTRIEEQISNIGTELKLRDMLGYLAIKYCHQKRAQEIPE